MAANGLALGHPDYADQFFWHKQLRETLFSARVAGDQQKISQLHPMLVDCTFVQTLQRYWNDRLGNNSSVIFVHICIGDTAKIISTIGRNR